MICLVRLAFGGTLARPHTFSSGYEEVVNEDELDLDAEHSVRSAAGLRGRLENLASHQRGTGGRTTPSRFASRDRAHLVTLMSCLLRVAIVVFSGLAILVVIVLRQRQQWLLALRDRNADLRARHHMAA